MNGWTRSGGYLGVVLLIGALATLLLLPNPRIASDSLRATRDALAGAVGFGYVLVAARLFYLAFRADRLAIRWLGFLAFWASIVAFVGYQSVLLSATWSPVA